MNMKMLVLTLLSLLLTTAARSQQAMQVNWQARMNDSLTIGLRMTYDARLKAGERARLADATVAATPISEPNAANISSHLASVSAGTNLSAVARIVTTVIPTMMKTEKYLLKVLLSTLQR